MLLFSVNLRYTRESKRQNSVLSPMINQMVAKYDRSTKEQKKSYTFKLSKHV